MSIRSRVIYWLRVEFNAIFGSDRQPRGRRTGRHQTGSASAEHEPSAGRGRRKPHSPTGAG